MRSGAANNTANDGVPFVTTFHPRNLVARKIISRNFQILREDSTTNNIFNKPPLKAFRLAKNLKDLLVRSRLARNLQTNHQVLSLVMGPFVVHVPYQFIIHNYNTQRAC